MQGGLLVGQEGKKPFSPVGLLIQPCSEQWDLGWEGRGERGWGGAGGAVIWAASSPPAPTAQREAGKCLCSQLAAVPCASAGRKQTKSDRQG